MNRKILFIFIVGLITLACFANVYYSLGQTKVTVFETLIDAKSCSNLVKGQDSNVSWILNTCTLTGSLKYSPIFLTNSSVQLTISSGVVLRIVSGYGFANYGQIINNGILSVESGLANYGILTNSKIGTIVITGSILSMNVSAKATSDSGIINNSGTLQINKNAYLSNANAIYNFGTLTNAGTLYNYVSGLNSTSIVINSGTIQGVAVKTSTNVAVQLNTTVTAKTTIIGCNTC